MSATRCAVGLVTWNGERDIAVCAKSLEEQTEPNLEVCWIDNASTDHTVDRGREASDVMPEPVINQRNLGFAGGHNMGFAGTAARYYLALNQDALLAPDYIERLCDWMDEREELALASGLILASDGLHRDPDALIYSAGLAMGRGRFPFELGMGRRPETSDRERRDVPAVTGAAMMIRREAVRRFAAADELFAPEFFAYFEEVDLALRLARFGYRCGVDGAALGWHAARGQGGRGNKSLRFHYIKNHWLITPRNWSWPEIFVQLPWIIKGELVHYMPQYLAAPIATARAKIKLFTLLGASRREFRRVEALASDDRDGRRKFLDLSRRLLNEEKAKRAAEK